ncbi:MAG: aldo/keto reductase [Allobranchiibius sp.]
MSSPDFGPLVLGGNVFGWTADRDASFAVLDAFVAAGGRSIDTADVYSSWVPDHSGGESERLIGEWLASRGHRDNVQIHTKVSMLSSRPGLSATNIAAAVDDSLGRLGTDHIDLYYAHRDDMDVDQSEYVAAFDSLVTAGKVRAVGASNFTAQRLQGALDLAHAHGLTPFTVTQDQWNLVERGVETTLLPTLQANGLAQLPYSGLASGFLTGKYRPGQSVESPRAGKAASYLRTPGADALLRVLDEIAEAHATAPAAVALAWLGSRPTVSAPIASARTVEQLTPLMASATLDLTSQELQDLTSASDAVRG